MGNYYVVPPSDMNGGWRGDCRWMSGDSQLLRRAGLQQRDTGGHKAAPLQVETGGPEASPAFGPASSQAHRNIYGIDSVALEMDTQSKSLVSLLIKKFFSLKCVCVCVSNNLSIKYGCIPTRWYNRTIWNHIICIWINVSSLFTLIDIWAAWTGPAPNFPSSAVTREKLTNCCYVH